MKGLGQKLPSGQVPTLTESKPVVVQLEPAAHTEQESSSGVGP